MVMVMGLGGKSSGGRRRFVIEPMLEEKEGGKARLHPRYVIRVECG